MYRVGIGYDMHRLEAGESFILAGVEIESDLGTVAHSDGDVLLHSVIDALLGGAGLGDIGEHFPDTDPKYKGADSAELTKVCVEMISEKGFSIENIDLTIILEKPKISPHKQKLKESLANICGIAPDGVNIKATTNEKSGFIGREEGIVVMSVCMLQKK
jgi:2-C-methyl-D-erythritol 2,4-cyclodiphosphate synthase